MLIKEIIDKIKFSKTADRIGPDIPFSHWKLHFKSTMFSLCKTKFKRLRFALTYILLNNLHFIYLVFNKNNLKLKFKC